MFDWQAATMSSRDAPIIGIGHRPFCR